MYKVNVDGEAQPAWVAVLGTGSGAGAGIDPCCAPVLASGPDAEPAATGSRRRRVWELGPHAHCPLIGVCFPIAALRRLASKVLRGTPQVCDYELHCGVATDCKTRSRMAEAVQRELDRRFMLVLRRAAMAKSEDALAAWWQAESASKDLPGALWALLTHARCTPELELRVLGQVHMLQHQVGMATRVELARFEGLMDENAVLTRRLAVVQQRSTRLTATHAQTVDNLQSEVLRLRGQLLARDSAVGLLREDLQTLQDATPGLKSRFELARQLELQAERMTDLRRLLQQARSEADALRARPVPTPPPATPAQVGELGATPEFGNQAVLCVGGRTGSVPVYRRLIEACGGRFLHHDGGEEHSASLLESTLAAADLVICQAGCVSHNAYWRVKDHCKRTGKRCVFVETPSASGLQRALAACAEPASAPGEAVG